MVLEVRANVIGLLTLDLCFTAQNLHACKRKQKQTTTKLKTRDANFFACCLCVMSAGSQVENK